MGNKSSSELKKYLLTNHPEALDFAFGSASSRLEAASRLRLFCESTLGERNSMDTYMEVVNNLLKLISANLR